MTTCHGAITTHHSPTPDRGPNHELVTPLGYGQPAQRGNTGGASPDAARDEERVGVGGEPSGGGSPDAATSKDWSLAGGPPGRGLGRGIAGAVW